jgi:glyoxylase-like metal-dependent hydrolase (beta-lactamase superfamily II)
MARRALERELERSTVVEIAPDVWMLEGYLGDEFLTRPPSSNVYVLRDGDSLLLLDSGKHAFYRERILQIIDRCRADGVKRITLMLTQGHFDHAFNNDVVLETGLPWQFLLPAPEVGRLDFAEDALQDLVMLGEYEDVLTTMFSWSRETAPVRVVEKISRSLARKLLRFSFTRLMGGARTLTDRAQILSLESRVKRRFGSVELQGWEVGRFFAVHDASHTPGHISLYDPENKLLLAGDVTVEINPAFFYTSMRACTEAAGWFRRMAEEGLVELAADSHRSKTFFPELFEKYRMEPLHETQLADAVRGKDACAAFFGTFEDYYRMLQEEVISAHRRIGPSTVGEIVEELRASPAPAVRLKCGLKWPAFPSRMDVLVASVLKEAGVTPERQGNRIVLPPA